MKILLNKKKDKRDTYDSFEQEANLLMRRVDWRFLLDNPNPEKSISFSNGLIAKAIKTISDTTVASDTNYRNSEYDLAVAVNPDQDILEAAYSALIPGGICYLEWEANAFFRTKFLRRRLESVGFEHINFYLPKPEPDHSSTQIWIPLESAGAVNYLIQQSFKETSKSILRQTVRSLRNALWLINPNLIISHPFLLSSSLKKFTISVICRKPSYNRAKETGVLEVKRTAPRYIVNYIDPQLFGTAQAAETNNTFILMLTKGKGINNKIVLIVFHEKERIPVTVIKLARIDISINPLLNEVNILTKVEENFGEMKGIPKILFCENGPEISAAGQTFLEGVPISTILRKENFRDLAFKVTSWLINLADKSRTVPRDNWWNDQIESVVGSFISSYGAVINKKQIQEFRDIIKILKFPYLVCEHRDVGPWNIMINDKGEVGLVDWESSRYSGLPGTDLIYFMVYLSLYLDGNWKPSDVRRCYRDILDRSTFTGAVFHDCSNHYFTELGLPHSLIKPIRLMTWATHSLERFNRWVDSPGRTLNSNMLRDSLYFICWEEELSDLE